ncbi:MAG: elongation factor 1-beta [Candidatus Pacearchaeota archaeon]
MGTMIIKLKVMLESPETNVEEIQKKVSQKMDSQEVNSPRFEVQPIAFGLKALMVLFEWPEEKELEEFQKSLENIEGVRSIEVVDMRRAL